MAPYDKNKLNSRRKSPRKIQETTNFNFKKKMLPKVTIGVPQSSIRDLFINYQNALKLKAIIDVEDEEISFNIKIGSPVLITEKGQTSKRRRPLLEFENENWRLVKVLYSRKYFENGFQRQFFIHFSPKICQESFF